MREMMDRVRVQERLIMKLCVEQAKMWKISLKFSPITKAAWLLIKKSVVENLIPKA